MPVQSLTYMLASGDPALCARVEPVSRSAGIQVSVVASGQAALAALTGGDLPDLALLDAELPGIPVEQLLAAVRSEESAQRLPIVVIARAITQEWLDRFNEGTIDDLIPRDAESSYWQVRATGVLRARRMSYELDALRENDARNAQMDGLTGVYSRETLLALLFRETDRVQRLPSPLSLLLFDVDDFGHWNARLGMEAGDELLREIARRSMRLLRSYDLLGRIGSDEFLIVLPGCSVVNAMMLAERLRAEVFSSPYHVGNESIRLSACFGIAHSRGRSPVVVLREAEQALSHAREAGPESIQIFEGLYVPVGEPVKFVSSTSGEELLAW